MCRSVPQTDASWTLTRTSVGPKDGTGISRTSAPAWAALFTTASIVSAIQDSFPPTGRTPKQQTLYCSRRLGGSDGAGDGQHLRRWGGQFNLNAAGPAGDQVVDSGDNDAADEAEHTVEDGQKDRHQDHYDAGSGGFGAPARLVSQRAKDAGDKEEGQQHNTQRCIDGSQHGAEGKNSDSPD